MNVLFDNNSLRREVPKPRLRIWKNHLLCSAGLLMVSCWTNHNDNQLLTSTFLRRTRKQQTIYLIYYTTHTIHYQLFKSFNWINLTMINAFIRIMGNKPVSYVYGKCML